MTAFANNALKGYSDAPALRWGICEMSVKYAVIGAMAAAAVAFLVNLAVGDLFDMFVAIGYLVATSLGVYKKLTTDISAAKNAALMLAAFAGFLVLVTLLLHGPPLIMLINVIAGGCLGYTFLQLQDLEKKANGTRGS
jgi:hypothetical protein